MKLNNYDLQRALKILPKSVKDLLQSHAKELILAGGFLKSTVERSRIKDIDLFATSPELARKVMENLVNNYKPEVSGSITTTKNSYSVKNVEGRFVQAIHRWSYPTPEELLKSFDFTMACAALWYDNTTEEWDSLVDDHFYEDVAAKRLTFRFPERQEDPAGSLIRVLKFVKKGYNIPAESLAGVVARVSKHADLVDTATPDPAEDSEKRWTRIIHGSISSVTGES